MGLFSQLVAGALRERSAVTLRRRTWNVEVEDFGDALVRVDVGDLDGSGDAPGINVAICHEFDEAAVALSIRESRQLRRALELAEREIPPHVDLGARHRRRR